MTALVVEHRLSGLAVCGIFLDQGSNPCPLHWQADSLPLSHQGSPGESILKRRRQNGTSDSPESTERAAQALIAVWSGLLSLFESEFP